MKDATGHDDNNQRRRPAVEVPHESVDELLSSYAPTQRERVLKGLRILARVAIRSYMEEQAGSQPEDDSEEESR